MTTSGSTATPRIRSARLDGPSRPLDRRVNAARDDLADIALAGAVIAPRYVTGVTQRCRVTTAMLRAEPDAGERAVSALLFGEAFTVFDLAGGWAWGQCGVDGYVGWVAADALGDAPPPTHRITAPGATVFARPDVKSPVIATLPLNAPLAAAPIDERFFAAAKGFVHRAHVGSLDARHADPVALALGFVGTPYVWGGRTRNGIDCSGLTQAVSLAAGVRCPRDSDQQAAAFVPVDPADRRRGDLAVFAGHVGILLDADTLVHATAFVMTTVIEPWTAVAARAESHGFRRLPPPSVTPCSGD